MKLSEHTISAIARALLDARRDLSKQLAYWRECQYTAHVDLVTTELRENANALAELADAIAPWLKQHPDWPSITANEPLTTN